VNPRYLLGVEPYVAAEPALPELIPAHRPRRAALSEPPRWMGGDHRKITMPFISYTLDHDRRQNVA